MKKSIEIEVPDGKIESISKDKDSIHIKFLDVRTLKDILEIAKEKYPLLYDKWAMQELGSYEEKLYTYRIVTAVLTNNEEVHLTTGTLYYPTVQLSESDNISSCLGNTIIGHVLADGRKYTVVGGSAYHGGDGGLSGFYIHSGRSDLWSMHSSLAVSSESIAKYISEYFGKLVFDVIFGESNCKYEWID